MFGNSKRIDDLERRLQMLERSVEARIDDEVSRLKAEVEGALREALGRIERDPQARLKLVVDSVERTLGARLQAASAQLNTAERSTKPAGPRAPIEYGVIKQAEQTGFLALWMGMGYNDKVTVFAGFRSPPQTEIGSLNSTQDINASFGTVIRAGEFWRVESESMSKRGETGLQGSFTPFF